MQQFKRFTPYRDRPLCFLDVETTGLKPRYHEVTEIGLHHEKKGGLCLQIAPRYMQRAEPEALRVSGYNAADWANANPFGDSVAQITEYLDGATLIGHNAPFDVAMLQGEYESLGLSHNDLFRDVIDTKALARQFLVPLGLNLIGLKACMNFIGVEDYDRRAHNAYEDALFAKRLYEFIDGNLKWHGLRNGKQIQDSLF